MSELLRGRVEKLIVLDGCREGRGSPVAGGGVGWVYVGDCLGNCQLAFWLVDCIQSN